MKPNEFIDCLLSDDPMALCVNEGLIKTTPAQVVVNNIVKWTRIPVSSPDHKDTNAPLRIQYAGVYDNTVLLDIKCPFTEWSTVLRWFNNMGWYTSRIWQGNKPPENYTDQSVGRLETESGWLTVKFEAKFDVEMGVPEFMYHATPSDKVNKILKQGLTPREGSKAVHPDRIYLAYYKEGAESLIPELKRETGAPEYTVLKINTGKCGLRIYNDHNFTGGAYTLKNISPGFISIARE